VLHEFLVETVREAGAIALGYFGKEIESWNKTPGRDDNPVSRADLEVDHFLKERLRSFTPDYGWLSEENEDNAERLNHRRVWIVDPIDGTRAFLKGLPHFTVSVALVEDRRPILGAVFNPALSEMFTAMVGQGAYLNGQRTTTSTQSGLEDCRMLAYADMIKSKKWPAAWPKMHIEQRNSAAYRMALVASGSFDATLSLSPKHDWDIAAAHLIAAEAGATVTHHDGSEPLYNGEISIQKSLVVASSQLHGLILARVRHMELPHTHGSQGR